MPEIFGGVEKKLKRPTAETVKTGLCNNEDLNIFFDGSLMHSSLTQ